VPTNVYRFTPYADGQAMLKSLRSITWSSVLLATTAVANDFKAQEIDWGEPSPIADHLGEAFQLNSIIGPQRSLKFPATVARDDGSVTYIARVEFQTGHLSFTNYCTYRNRSDEIVAELNAPLAAVGEQIANGYIISHSQKTKTEQAGKQCAMEITDGTYLLMKHEHEFRLYVDPKNFFELSPTK
jgi:hypothetical protein